MIICSNGPHNKQILSNNIQILFPTFIVDVVLRSCFSTFLLLQQMIILTHKQTHIQLLSGSGHGIVYNLRL